MRHKWTAPILICVFSFMLTNVGQWPAYADTLSKSTLLETLAVKEKALTKAETNAHDDYKALKYHATHFYDESRHYELREKLTSHFPNVENAAWYKELKQKSIYKVLLVSIEHDSEHRELIKKHYVVRLSKRAPKNFISGVDMSTLTPEEGMEEFKQYLDEECKKLNELFMSMRTLSLQYEWLIELVILDGKRQLSEVYGVALEEYKTDEIKVLESEILELHIQLDVSHSDWRTENNSH